MTVQTGGAPGLPGVRAKGLQGAANSEAERAGPGPLGRDGECWGPAPFQEVRRPHREETLEQRLQGMRERGMWRRGDRARQKSQVGSCLAGEGAVRRPRQLKREQRVDWGLGVQMVWAL